MVGKCNRQFAYNLHEDTLYSNHSRPIVHCVIQSSVWMGWMGDWLCRANKPFWRHQTGIGKKKGRFGIFHMQGGSGGGGPCAFGVTVDRVWTGPRCTMRRAGGRGQGCVRHEGTHRTHRGSTFTPYSNQRMSHAGLLLRLRTEQRCFVILSSSGIVLELAAHFHRTSNQPAAS